MAHLFIFKIWHIAKCCPMVYIILHFYGFEQFFVINMKINEQKKKMVFFFGNPLFSTDFSAYHFLL